MGATSVAGSVYHSKAHELASDFNGFFAAQSLIFCEVFCRLLLVFRPLSSHRCIICPSINDFGLPLRHLLKLSLKNAFHMEYSTQWSILYEAASIIMKMTVLVIPVESLLKCLHIP